MTRQVVQSYEIPEAKAQVKKQTSVYPKEFIDSKLDILLGLIANRLPIIGMTIVEKLLNTPQFREILRERLVEYYQSMHQWCFSELKSVIRSTMTKDDFPISLDTMKNLVEDLENEYAKSLPELGVEPPSVTAAFCANQQKWYNEHFKFSEVA